MMYADLKKYRIIKPVFCSKFSIRITTFVSQDSQEAHIAFVYHIR